MKKLFILFLFISAVISVNAQVEIEWQKCLGGTSSEEAISVLTNNHSVIITGYTTSNDFDVIGNNGTYNIWIIKLDWNGNILNSKCIGGTGLEEPKYTINSKNNSLIIAAGTNANNGDVSGNHGSYDFWIVKLDSNFNIQWQRCYGGTLQDEPGNITETYDGGYIIAGYTYSNDGDVYGNHGGSDIWVVKIDSIGNIQFQKCIGGSSNDMSRCIIQNRDSSYTITGYTQSTDGDIAGNNGGSDIFIANLDTSGSIQWLKCYGGSNFDDAYSMLQTNDDGYLLVGNTFSNDLDVSGNNGLSDSWLIKTDFLGNLEWQKCYGGSSSEFSFSLIEANNSFIISGRTSSNNGNITNNYGSADVWIYKVDSIGNLIWQSSYGGTIWDGVYCAKHIDNNYFVVGSTYSNDIDVQGNHNTQSSDFWIIKLIESNISGQLFHDLNENGIKDTLEQGIVGHLVRLNPGNHYTFTNNDGYYYFRGDTGITNTVKYVAQQYWVETTNNYYYYVTLDSLSQIVDTLDYAVKSRVNVNDVSVYITGAPTRTNFETHYWLSYKNWGTVTANGTIEFQYDPLLTYNTSTLTPVSHVGNTLTFAYDTLGPGAQRMLRVDFQVPDVQNLGDTLHSYAMITPLVPDTFVTNNYDTLQQVITGSYDPNDKTVTPAGYEQWGFVEHGQRLTYTIHFQNTGTDTAITVVLRDTLDADLDIETFQVEAYSHPVTWQLHSGNELFFTFQNIILPDSNVNEPESHGFIRYSISPKPGLTDGTTATNTSYIFFDYNPAVVTNTTLNTFVTNIPVAKPILEVLKNVVFPNPSNDLVYINLPEFTRKVEVYSLNGELIQQQVPQKQVAEINVKDLTKGVYIVKMYSRKGVITTKFVKE